ncbi:hypothetical protein T439DRAFT_252348 [Meredithblackwellia eburnea MCA 4105]
MSLPRVTHVLELCLDARHLPTSVAFYQNILGLGKPFLDTERMAGFHLGQSNLLLFQRGQTGDDVRFPSSEPGGRENVIPSMASINSTKTSNSGPISVSQCSREMM